jgi:hypothetical protein
MGGMALSECSGSDRRGVVGYDFADPQSGEQNAAFDLAWPSGIQEELSQPVAVLLDELAATITLASQAGFRCFTNTAFRRYVEPGWAFSTSGK